MTELLQWLPLISALLAAGGAIVAARIEGGATRRALDVATATQTKALDEHRREARESALRVEGKLDALASADTALAARVVALEGARDEHTRRLDRKRELLDDHETRLRALERGRGVHDDTGVR